MLIPGRGSTWCPQRRNGKAVSLYTAEFGSFHTLVPLLPSWGLSTLALDGNSCLLKALTLPLSGSLPRECGTQLLCLLCPGQSVVSLPACKESVPVSSPPTTSPTPTGPSYHQTSRRVQTSPSPPQPCPWAARSPGVEEAHLRAALPDPRVPVDAKTPTQPGSPSIQLLSPLPWPHADPGQFPLTHHPLVSTPSHRAVISPTLPSHLISGLFPFPLAHMFPASSLGANGEETERGLRGWRQAYPAGPDWQMRKCKGGEEPGPPEVPASPCRSAGSLPLAGRRLGGEKARRREQERGAEGLEGGVEGGGQQAGEGGLKQRAANHPRGIPSSWNQGHREESWWPLYLLPLPNGPLPQEPLSLLASGCWGPLPNATVF